MTNSCSAQDVLNDLAGMLRSGDTRHLDTLSLRFGDLEPNPDNRRAAAEFDAAVLASNRTDIMHARQRYRPVSIRSVKLGTMERHVRIEGTEFFVDRIRNSAIVVDPGGTSITVASLARGSGCWRLENFGLGVRGLEPPSEQVQSRKTPGPKTSGFRLFSASDYCIGATIYRLPSGDAEIGTLIESYRNYRDPKSGRVFEAVLLQSLATGHVRGLWMSPKQLARTYVDGADRALQKCSWSTREEEVSPLADETPADAPRDGSP